MWCVIMFLVSEHRTIWLANRGGVTRGAIWGHLENLYQKKDKI